MEVPEEAGSGRPARWPTRPLWDRPIHVRERDGKHNFTIAYYTKCVYVCCVVQTGANIVNALDPNQLILYKLFRDATKYENGHHVKVSRNVKLGMRWWFDIMFTIHRI